LLLLSCDFFFLRLCRSTFLEKMESWYLGTFMTMEPFIPTTPTVSRFASSLLGYIAGLRILQFRWNKRSRERFHRRRSR
jgi:hypothetical protein